MTIVHMMKMESLMTVEHKGAVILFTGFSGSGKSTIATAVKNRISNCVILDGDVGRKTYSKDLGFSIKDRILNNERAAAIASYLEAEGYIVLVSYISPAERIRSIYRKLCNNYIEIYVKCPIEICERRDPKGLYKQVRDGKIKSFTGIHSDAPYEEPQSPDITVNTEIKSITGCVNLIIKVLKEML